MSCRHYSEEAVRELIERMRGSFDAWQRHVEATMDAARAAIRLSSVTRSRGRPWVDVTEEANRHRDALHALLARTLGEEWQAEFQQALHVRQELSREPDLDTGSYLASTDERKDEMHLMPVEGEEPFTLKGLFADIDDALERHEAEP